MNNVAVLADMVDHHPDWSNVYNQIAVTLNTHTVQGISEKDIYMAKAIEKIYDIVNQEEREYTDIIVKDFEKAFD